MSEIVKETRAVMPLKSLTAIERVRKGDLQVLKNEKWLKYLALTSEYNVNLERLHSMEEMKHHFVLGYVEKTLNALATLDLTEVQTYILEQTLKWSEVAKSGLQHQRNQWTGKGYNLFAHNIGSAAIYLEEGDESNPQIRRIIHTLIITHGLIGQYIRGEVPLSDNQPLYQLVEEGTLSAAELKQMLKALNYCIVAAVDESIWQDISKEADAVLDFVVQGQVDKQYAFKDRIRRLRAVSIRNGENFDAEYEKILSDEALVEKLSHFLDEADLWYVEAALYDFSFEEFIKIFLIVSQATRTDIVTNSQDAGASSQDAWASSQDAWASSRHSLRPARHSLRPARHSLRPATHSLRPARHSLRPARHSLRPARHSLRPFQGQEPCKVKHISFEWLMKAIYYQHDGRKRVNIYKKRIIEKYLAEITIKDILKGSYKENLHVAHKVVVHENLEDTVFFTFKFSSAGSRLIEFCIEAEKSDTLYESAIILLFDLFGLRRDQYDRFYEEEKYLATMNQSIDYKKVILNYITGNSIVDIGPGGGALMDLIEERFPDKKVLGVDIAQNVLDSLRKKKQLENRKWDVLYGDALNLAQSIERGSVDTVIFCSILHELFSYIEYNGRKFNHETLAAAFKSVFQVLPVGGRMIIRDGIMTEPIEQKRIIRFLSEEGMQFLERYAGDFKGREIAYKIIGHNEVLMPVNDAMEFLYTYTWGEKSYVHEVNEQFGYFTPTGFKQFIASVLGTDARMIELKHFLQEGYTIALSQKIAFFDESRNPIRLPDSTCIVVIEKTNDSSIKGQRQNTETPAG